MKLRSLAVVFGVVCSLPVGCRPSTPPPQALPASPLITLRSRAFAPEAGVEPALLQGIRERRPVDRLHVIVQFHAIPTLEERERLTRAHGMRILDPLSGRAYFASIPPDTARATELAREARWIGAIRPEDKIAPGFGRAPLPVRAQDSGLVPLLVQFFVDVPVETQQRILRDRGIEHARRVVFLNGWTGVAPVKTIPLLAAEDAVQWIDNVPGPPDEDNEGVRGAKGVNADAIHAAPYGLSGSGVTVAMWEYSPPSLTHDDFANRIKLADDSLPPWARTQAHNEKVAENSVFDIGEGIYRDVDDTRKVSPTDIRVTSVGAFGVGTVVAVGDPDVGDTLLAFSDGDDGVPPERFWDKNRDAVYSFGEEAIYRDNDADWKVDPVGDTKLSTAAAPASEPLSRFPTNPHGHSTQVAGTLMGDGARSLAEEGSAKWKGVAPGAHLSAHGVCIGIACASQDWVPPHEVGWIAWVNAGYLKAATSGAVIAANAWGPRNSHCHQVASDETCYDALSHLYDVAASGRLTDGSSAGTAPMLIVGSAGNSGSPERHTEKPPENNQFDKGESIYRDMDGDGTVSAGDWILLGGGEGIGTKIIDFTPNERHRETGTGPGTYESPEGLYRDVDGSGHVNANDVRILVAGFTDGSTVGSGASDVDVGGSLRRFVLWGSVRIGSAAKNTLQVGDIASDATVVGAWSARGPTDDGRLKPDLVAAGSRVAEDGMVMTTFPVNRYRPNYGTSIATGAAAGSAALLTQWYKEACTSAGPAPDVLKALLIHAAEDVTATPAGDFPGPDFASGFGRLRIKEAADLISHHVRGTISVAGALPDIPVVVGALRTLKVTLVWSDPPRSPNAAVSPGEVLLNDLDLTLIAPDGTQHTSWLLDPSSPSLAATRGAVAATATIPETARDRRNPVEQVVVDDAQRGTWKIRISAEAGRLKLPPQEFVVVSEIIPPAMSPCASTPASDVWIRDNPTDNGNTPSVGRLWLGPDLWNRLAADGLAAHQNPEHGQPNYLYATVRNRSAVAAKATTMEMWIAHASTGLIWPASFTYVGRIFVPNLAAGEVRQIGPLEWSPPAPVVSGHFCMYMRLLSAQDAIAFTEGANIGTNARNSNNIAYRNLNVVDLSSSRRVAFLVRNTRATPASVDLMLTVPGAFLRSGTLIVSLAPELERRWSREDRARREGIVPLREESAGNAPSRPGSLSPPFTRYRVVSSRVVIPGFALDAYQAERVVLTFFSAEIRGTSHDIDVMQRVGEEIVGGIRYVVRTRGRP